MARSAPVAATLGNLAQELQPLERRLERQRPLQALDTLPLLTSLEVEVSRAHEEPHVLELFEDPIEDLRRLEGPAPVLRDEPRMAQVDIRIIGDDGVTRWFTEHTPIAEALRERQVSQSVMYVATLPQAVDKVAGIAERVIFA